MRERSINCAWCAFWVSLASEEMEYSTCVYVSDSRNGHTSTKNDVPAGGGEVPPEASSTMPEEAWSRREEEEQSR